jgi:molybdopterin-synthase adenylyltransferase
VTSSVSAPRPQLKNVSWERAGTELRVVYDWRAQLLIEDPDGTVAALLELLRQGGRTEHELAAALSAGRDPVPVADVRAATALLDSYGLVEDGQRLGGLSAAEAERHFSNVAFFETFGSLACSREDFCRLLADRHVLALGTGGLNSNTIPHLCGLGVGRLTLLDRDVVEPRNFARQYLYRWSDLGMRKVEPAAAWVRHRPARIQRQGRQHGPLPRLAQIHRPARHGEPHRPQYRQLVTRDTNSSPAE